MKAMRQTDNGRGRQKNAVRVSSLILSSLIPLSDYPSPLP